MISTIHSDEVIFYEPDEWPKWSPSERCLYLAFWIERERAGCEVFKFTRSEMSTRSGVPASRAKDIVQDWLDCGILERAGEPRFSMWRFAQPRIEMR